MLDENHSLRQAEWLIHAHVRGTSAVHMAQVRSAHALANGQVLLCGWWPGYVHTIIFRSRLDYNNNQGGVGKAPACRLGQMVYFATFSGGGREACIGRGCFSLTLLGGVANMGSCLRHYQL